MSPDENTELECVDCGKETKNRFIIDGEKKPVCAACQDAHEIMQETRPPAAVISGDIGKVDSLKEKSRRLADNRLNGEEA